MSNQRTLIKESIDVQEQATINGKTVDFRYKKETEKPVSVISFDIRNVLRGSYYVSTNKVDVRDAQPEAYTGTLIPEIIAICEDIAFDNNAETEPEGGEGQEEE